VILYKDDSDPGPQTEAVKNYSHQFLKWRSLRARQPEEDESVFIRRGCMAHADRFAFITYLNTHDYIMPRGAGKGKKGQLPALLSINEFRFGAGTSSTLDLAQLPFCNTYISIVTTPTVLTSKRSRSAVLCTND
jgi:hypothetical protein